MAITEAASLKIYEAAISPAFQAYLADGATDEAHAAYSAIVTPLWAEHEARIAEDTEDDTVEEPSDEADEPTDEALEPVEEATEEPVEEPAPTPTKTRK